MLPGFRFVLTTIVLAASVLIFGLGAAALLRATHDEVASLPSLRAMGQQPPVFAEPLDVPPRPTLALLRVDLPAVVETPTAQIPASKTPAIAPAEQGVQQDSAIPPARALPAVVMAALAPMAAPQTPEPESAVATTCPAPGILPVAATYEAAPQPRAEPAAQIAELTPAQDIHAQDTDLPAHEIASPIVLPQPRPDMNEVRRARLRAAAAHRRRVAAARRALLARAKPAPEPAKFQLFPPLFGGG